MPGGVKAKPSGVGYAAGLDAACFDCGHAQGRPAIRLAPRSAMDDQDPAILIVCDEL
ncbi:MAG: hypothetical protein LC808_12465 [Actinobacteria bacterium]|nr:hypothetical protein [Actinomycetota bacterium]